MTGEFQKATACLPLQGVRGRKGPFQLPCFLFQEISPTFFFSFSIYLASLGLSCGMKDPVPR